MPTSKICLTDVNTWLALAAPGHLQHAAALRWFESLDEGQAVFCRITQMGFLRLLTNASVMKTDRLSAPQAWALYRNLRSDWRVRFASEPAGLESTWIALMREGAQGANSWTDAYLAAFAIGHRYTLVSFDRGFQRWKNKDLAVHSPHHPI